MASSSDGSTHSYTKLRREDPTYSSLSSQCGERHVSQSFCCRLWRLCGHLLPRVRSRAALVLLGVVLLCAAEQVVVYWIGVIPSKYFAVLGNKDMSAFKRLTVYSVCLVVLIAGVKSVRGLLVSLLYITWRENLCRALHDLYFSSSVAFYRLNVLTSHIDNPDQRMSQDVERLCNTLSSILSRICMTPFIIVYYSYSVFCNTGYVGLLSIYGFFTVASVINRLFMSPIIGRVVQQERLEGDFRSQHMMVRVHAEAVAFGGDSHVHRERVTCELTLCRLTSAQLSLAERRQVLAASLALTDYLGSIVNYLVVAAAVFSGHYDQLTPQQLSAVISQNSFVCMYLIYNFTQLVNVSSDVASLAGVTHRVAELYEWLCDNQPSTANNTDFNADITTDTITDTITDTTTGFTTDTNTDFKTDFNTDTITDTTTGFITDTTTDTRTGFTTDTITDTKTDFTTDTNTDTKTDFTTDTNTDTKTDFNTDTTTDFNTDTITDTKTDSTTDTNTDTKTDFNTDTITDTKTYSTTDTITDTTSDMTTDINTDSITDTIRKRKVGHGVRRTGTALTVGQTCVYCLRDVTVDTPVFSQPHSASQTTVAPSGRRLLKALSLQIKLGRSLMICGASGCGKTALLRMLRGLWTPTAGRVQRHLCEHKPNSQSSSSSTVMFVPQKPFFSSAATLRQLVVYPHIDVLSSHSSHYLPEAHERVTQALSLAGLEDLLQRYGDVQDRDGDGDDVSHTSTHCHYFNWYDILSAGEMQRVCFARVFYHRPDVVFLDESTSALQPRLACQLYQECVSADVTVVSVAHGPLLERYHSRKLLIHSDASWSLHSLH